MKKHFPKISVAMLVLTLGLLSLFIMQREGVAAKPSFKPSVLQSSSVQVSAPLRELVPILAQPGPYREIPRALMRKGSGIPDQTLVSKGPDLVLQEIFGGPGMPDPIRTFEGVGNLASVAPPDTQGDVGPNHYVQWVNLHYQIWDKNGTSLYGPAAGNTLWQSAVGQDACKNTNDGDPITLYDPQADRWLMSQFALPNFPNGPFYQCVAISTTGDPTGSYTLYQFQFSVMNDYPKFGIWPDGYYMSINQFSSGSTYWAGAGVVAFERAKMLAGLPAQMVYFDLSGVNIDFGGMLPADWDGSLAPPIGAPNYFAEVDDSTTIGPDDALRLWKFHVDWTTPANSTFGVSGQPNAVLPVAAFTPICPSTRDCIPQPSTGQKVDAIGDRLMYRLQYRNFGDHEALVTNHTVDAGSGRAGVRWYEIRNPGGSPVIYQQGTYAPADTENRWMGSIAMDRNGNMALGYSVSSGTIYPSVRYTGRLVGDPLGTMPQGETELVTGLGSATDVNRWGDYSMMAVDPADDCTFWYTQEYVQTTGSFHWNTRIGSFKFGSCSAGPTGTVQGTVTVAGTGNPISGATVVAGTSSTHTNASGQYSLVLPVGGYNMTVSAYGYNAGSASGVLVNDGLTTTQNFALTPLPTVHTCGTVSDGSGHGWGLYARIDISGSGYPGSHIFTDPATGQYCVDLIEGQTYTFTVTALNGGYATKVITGTPSTQLDFQLLVDGDVCNALGYTQSFALTENLDSATPPALPANWAIATVSGTAGNWLTKIGTNHPSGQLAHSTPNLIYFNSYNAASGSSTRLYRTSGLDLTSAPMALVTFWMYHDIGYSSDDDRVQVQVSTTGGTTWTDVGSAISRYDGSTGWKKHSVDLGTYIGAGMSDVRLGLLGISAYGNDVHIDDLALATSNCVAQSGGLVVGNVYDANTHDPKIGATVDAGGGYSTKSAATLDDAQIEDGFYSLFLPSAQYNLTASYYGFGNAAHNLTVANNVVYKRDFNLPAGFLAHDPPNFTVKVALGFSKNTTLNMSNAGGLDATYQLVELKNPPALPTGPFETPIRVVKPFKQAFQDSQSLPMPAPPTGVPTINGAGDVIHSWLSNLSQAWGIAYDRNDNTVWVASPSVSWSGSDTLYEFSPAGNPTGNTYPFNWSHGDGPADAAYNWNTGKLWIVNVATGNNCIYEIDPAAGATGSKICPGGSSGFTASQRGLAYDPTNDTYFAGGWNDLMVHHFDASGVVLDEINVGLPISGLAYNPDTKHLFAMVNADPNLVYVLDAANNYAILGQFSISGFTGYSGAGLEIDCDGNLWAVDQKTEKVYQVASGETASFCTYDVPWLSENPAAGTVTAGGGQSATLTLDASQGITLGQYTAQLMVKTNTPYRAEKIPVTMVVSTPHTIMASAGAGGTITPPGTVTVADGDDQTFTIKANPGYVLTGVLVDGVNVGPAQSYSFINVTADHTISAQFVKLWKISTRAGAGGSIKPKGPVWVKHGMNQTFRITPKKGFKISKLVVDRKSVKVKSSYTFKRCSANHTIKASFAKIN